MSRNRRRGSAATLMAFAMATLVFGIVVGSGAEVAPLALDARRAGPEHQAMVLAEAAVCAALDDLAAGRDPSPFEGARLGAGTADLRLRLTTEAGGRLELEATGRAPAPLLLGPGGAVQRRLRVAVACRVISKDSGPRLVLGVEPARVVAWEELP
jgi:hypothetical protein